MQFSTHLSMSMPRTAQHIHESTADVRLRLHHHLLPVALVQGNLEGQVEECYAASGDGLLCNKAPPCSCALPDCAAAARICLGHT